MFVKQSVSQWMWVKNVWDVKVWLENGRMCECLHVWYIDAFRRKNIFLTLSVHLVSCKIIKSAVILDKAGEPYEWLIHGFVSDELGYIEEYCMNA